LQHPLPLPPFPLRPRPLFFFTLFLFKKRRKEGRNPPSLPPSPSSTSFFPLLFQTTCKRGLRIGEIRKSISPPFFLIDIFLDCPFLFPPFFPLPQRRWKGIWRRQGICISFHISFVFFFIVAPPPHLPLPLPSLGRGRRVDLEEDVFFFSVPALQVCLLPPFPPSPYSEEIELAFLLLFFFLFFTPSSFHPPTATERGDRNALFPSGPSFPISPFFPHLQIGMKEDRGGPPPFFPFSPSPSSLFFFPFSVPGREKEKKAELSPLPFFPFFLPSPFVTLFFVPFPFFFFFSLSRKLGGKGRGAEDFLSLSLDRRSRTSFSYRTGQGRKKRR